MTIQKNNDYYNKEFTNDIEEHTFNPSFIEKEIILINDLKLQSELDVQLDIDILGKTGIQLKIPLEI